MATVNELLRTEQDGTLSFGDYTLEVKSKLQDFEHEGDLYKVKTFFEITKLERNGMFVYESVPGTAVFDFSVGDDGVSFRVSGNKDAQITLELQDDTDYDVCIGNGSDTVMKTNRSGKLTLSVELAEGDCIPVTVKKH